MPLFNVKVKHDSHEAEIPVRAESADAAKAHVKALHGFDYLSHFRTIPHAAKKKHANRMVSQFGDEIVEGHAVEVSITSVEQVFEECPGCSAKRPAQ